MDIRTLSLLNFLVYMGFSLKLRQQDMSRASRFESIELPSQIVVMPEKIGIDSISVVTIVQKFGTFSVYWLLYYLVPLILQFI